MTENEKVRAIKEDLFPNFNNEIYQIEKYGISKDIIKKIRKKQEYKKEHMKELYNRYKICEESVPIFGRSFTEDGAINNKLNNDYFGEIVRTTVGYFAGSPFSYTYSQVDKDNTGNGEVNVPDETLERNIDIVKHFVLYNGLADKDVEATKISSICGYVGRLLYIDKEGEVAVAMVDPWETTILSRYGIEHPEYALREIEDIEVLNDNGESKKVTKLEFYDNKYIYYFEDGEEGLIPDYSLINAEKGIYGTKINGVDFVIQEHLFDYCPLQAIPQNKEALGIAENVLSLIDAIDRSLSDCNSEVEAFKLAYLLITGADISDEELTKARETGTFVLPPLGEVDMKYLIKEINDTFIENHLTRLEKNIYKFSSTPDLSDSTFNQASSGIALKMKLFPLETRCVQFERKYHEANMYMFKVLASTLSKKNIAFDPLEVTIEYKRSLPLDLEYIANVQAKLKGLVSEQTRLNLADFCDDAEYEIELMKKEQEDIEPLEFDKEEADTNMGTMPETSIL